MNTPMVENSWVAFANSKRVALGTPVEVARAVKNYSDAHPTATLLIFDALTSQPVEIDLRSNLKTVLNRLPKSVILVSPDEPSPEQIARAPGRPKLGVVAREVTLLPRHWDWLSSQPGGISVALRKLVEQAQKDNIETDRIRLAQESAYRFITAMAGNQAGYEEATRALFAREWKRFQDVSSKWPKDIRHHALTLVEIIKHSVQQQKLSKEKL